MTEQQVIQQAKQGNSVYSINISDNTYNNTDELKDFVRSSDLKRALDGELDHYYRANEIPQPSTEKPDPTALAAGHYIEDFISGLTPSELDKKYLVFDKEDRPDAEKTMAAKENKQWKADLAIECEERNLTWIERDQVKCCENLIFSESQNEILQVIQAADQQVTCLWRDQNTGIKLRTRTDFTDSLRRLIIDAKSTAAKTLNEFKRQLFNLNYPLQALLQIEGARQTGYISGNDPIGYLWFVISKKWPYNVFVVEYTHESQQRDKQILRRAISTHGRYEALKLMGMIPESKIEQI